MPGALHPVGERSLDHLLQERAAEAGDRTFLVFEDAAGEVGETSYATFAERVARCAGGLAAAGVQPGDRVVVHLRNCPELLVAWFALSRLGAVFVPTNVAGTAAEIAHVLEVTGARMTVTEPAFLPAVEGGAAAAGRDVQVVVARERLPGRTAFADLEAAAPAPAAAIGPDDLAELIFTSGTTRRPKAVMLTHANCLRAGLDAVHCLWLQEGERCLTALPMFHVNAQAMSALAALTVGGTLILLEEFRASRFWSQVREHRATQTAIVAMQLRTMLAQPPDPRELDHDVRRLFYAINVSDREREAFEQRFGVTLINGYGLSEAMVLVAVAPVVGPRRWPSIGLPSPGRTVRLLGEDGAEAPPGEPGEIVVDGIPGRSLMLGYYGDEEATAQTLRGGRLHTGDNAYADEAGHLYFFDRKKDMIKRAGENVSAMEVEAALLEHPGVAEAAVVGVPDPIRDESVAAVVVRAAGDGPAEQELREHCAGLLAGFKVPSRIVFRDELPKTSIGKVRKDALRAELAASGTPA